MQGHQQPQPGFQRESSMLQRDPDRLHVPGNRMNDGSFSARSSWHSVIAKALPAHHQSSPALAISGLSNSTKTLRDDWDHHSTPHTPTFSSFPGMGFPPNDPDMGLQREKSFEACQDLTPEGLSWKRLHMSRAKLKATATTSELLSGFAMVAMVELQINTPTNVPEWLFVLFAVCTTVLVSVHIFALMISTYILPNVDAVSKMQHVASSMSKRASLNGGYQKLGHMGEHSNHASMANLMESPHERMRNFIELAWAFSTVLGLFLFLVELAILCWVKFWDYSFTAAWSATIIVIPVLVIFVIFVAHFYRSLVEQKVVSTTSNLHDLEAMRNTLHDVEVTGDRDGSGRTDESQASHNLRCRFSTRHKGGRGEHHCAVGDEANAKDEAHGSAGIGIYSPVALSWRRLHVSRAKLKEAVISSTLLCAFALECMVELQVQAPTGCPDWLFTLFAVNTTLLISVHVIAAMISTYILPEIDGVFQRQAEWEGTGLDPSLWGVQPSESPHDRMRGFIEMASIFSSVLGLFLFLTEVSLLSWVKFWDVCFAAAAYGSAAVIPFFILCLAYCIKFHSILAGHTYAVRAQGLKEIEDLKERLDANCSVA